MTTDKFLNPVKEALAFRAGYRCSYPGCPAVTAGPSQESSSATSNTGEAAHIAAASSGKGSRRFDAGMSPEQRRDIENGIWCCRSHAKLIDNDETTFTVEMLKHWRELAVKRAFIRQALGNKVSDESRLQLRSIGLAPESICVISNFSLNSEIGAAIEYACVEDIAGAHVAHTVRDFLVEYARNALTHGQSGSVDITVSTHSIKVTDSGLDFPLAGLFGPNGDGGASAYRALLSVPQIGALSRRRTLTQTNELIIPFVLASDQLPNVNPCAVALTYKEFHAGAITSFASFVTCDTIYIVVPEYPSYSDAKMLDYQLKGELINKSLNEKHKFVIVLSKVSESVLARFRTLFENAEVVAW